jgi:hypothetical protein
VRCGAWPGEWRGEARKLVVMHPKSRPSPLRAAQGGGWEGVLLLLLLLLRSAAADEEREQQQQQKPTPPQPSPSPAAKGRGRKPALIQFALMPPKCPSPLRVAQGGGWEGVLLLLLLLMRSAAIDSKQEQRQEQQPTPPRPSPSPWAKGRGRRRGFAAVRIAGGARLTQDRVDFNRSKLTCTHLPRLPRPRFVVRLLTSDARVC